MFKIPSRSVGNAVVRYSTFCIVMIRSETRCARYSGQIAMAVSDHSTNLYDEGAQAIRLFEAITTDALRGYSATLDELGCREMQEVDRKANNRV